MTEDGWGAPRPMLVGTDGGPEGFFWLQWAHRLVGTRSNFGEGKKLHVLVITRGTPDTAARIELDDGGAVTWGDAATVVNPWDEYALEEGIRQAESAGGQTTVLALGSELHLDALKHSLAMGIQNAILLEDAALDPRDSLAYARAAAGVVRKLGDIRLVIFGKESVDVGTDQHSVQLARMLGWPMISYVSRILEMADENGNFRVERMLEPGLQTLRSRLPAVISVMKDINEPRYPSFMGIRRASRAKIPRWTLAELGVEATPSGAAIDAYRELPRATVETEMLPGEANEQAQQLVERLLEEKVL